MDRSRARLVAINQLVGLLLAAAMLISASGCPALLATGIYVWEGGNLVPAECDALKGERVVVMCRPPSSHEYRHAGASRNIAQRVSELLVEEREEHRRRESARSRQLGRRKRLGRLPRTGRSGAGRPGRAHRARRLRAVQRQDAVPRPRRCDRERVRHARPQQSSCGIANSAKSFIRSTAAFRLRTSRCSNSSASSSKLSPTKSP